MIRSGARRLLVLVGVLVAAAAVAALLAIATGAGVARSAALGCYLVGSLSGFLGFALGSRGLFRPRGPAPDVQTVTQQRESRSLAALLMLFGVVLVLLGAAVDPHARLV